MTEPSWADVGFALQFFGLAEDDLPGLERIIVTYDLDADFDDEGQLLLVDVGDAQEALYGEHERAVGYRPDDPKEMERTRVNTERRLEHEKTQRRVQRQGMARRVSRQQTAKKRRWPFRRKR